MVDWCQNNENTKPKTKNQKSKVGEGGSAAALYYEGARGNRGVPLPLLIAYCTALLKSACQSASLPASQPSASEGG